MKKKCNKCEKEKELFEFYKDRTKKDGYRHQCKSCIKENNKEYYKEYSKEYYEKNKEKISKKRKKYYKEYYENNKGKKKEYFQKNKEKINEKQRGYRRNKRQTNPLYKLRRNISTRIYQSIKNQGYTKRSQAYKILGCTYEEFKEYLENQFTDGMSWENQGEWHLDHIYPVSLAKDEEELIKLNHYTNFQPLWADDNLKKGNKIL